MAKNELLPFADGEDANVLPTNQWEALTDILENGFQSGIAKSEQVNRVLAQGAVASYVLGQLIVDELNQDATLDKDTLYQRLVSALESKAKDVCLPLSGGTMTGDISFSKNSTTLYKTTNDGSILIRGGGNSYSYGGALVVYGKDHATSPGEFSLVANKGTDSHLLTGRPNGSLTWGNKEVITSAGGTVANVLVVSGNNAFVQQADDDKSITLFGGKTYQSGAWMTLCGKDYPNRSGYIDLIARDASQSSTLRLCPNGSAMWGGKEVERVNAKGTNYIRYESGLQIVWGSVNISNSATITFPVAFKNADYSAFSMKYSAYNTWFTNLTTTRMTINTGEGGITTTKYMAIGLWK